MRRLLTKSTRILIYQRFSAIAQAHRLPPSELRRTLAHIHAMVAIYGSIAETARRAKLCERTLGRLLKGHVRNPPPETRNRIADAHDEAWEVARVSTRACAKLGTRHAPLLAANPDQRLEALDPAVVADRQAERGRRAEVYAERVARGLSCFGGQPAGERKAV